MIRINLLPFRTERKKENVRRQASLFLLSLFLVLLVLFYYNFSLNSKIGKLNKKIETTNTELTKYNEINKKIARIKKNLEILRKKMAVTADVADFSATTGGWEAGVCLPGSDGMAVGFGRGWDLLTVCAFGAAVFSSVCVRIFLRTIFGVAGLLAGWSQPSRTIKKQIKQVKLQMIIRFFFMMFQLIFESISCITSSFFSDRVPQICRLPPCMTY